MGQVRHKATAGSRKALFHDKLGQRGSVAVEAAIVFPLLIVLTFGIIEFSLLMRDHVATTSVVRSGARTASALPREPTMVETTRQAMNKAGSAMPTDSYEELWIYAANDAGYPGAAGNKDFDPTDCTTNCTRFAWDDSREQFILMSGNTTWPEHVNACPGSAAAMSVGVYLKAKHTWVTGLFFDETYVADRAVMKFEPKPPQSCKD